MDWIYNQSLSDAVMFKSLNILTITNSKDTCSHVFNKIPMPVKADDREETPLDFGSGHDRFDPGLVYGFHENDLIDLLCHQHHQYVQTLITNLIWTGVTHKN